MNEERKGESGSDVGAQEEAFEEEDEGNFHEDTIGEKQKRQVVPSSQKIKPVFAKPGTRELSVIEEKSSGVGVIAHSSGRDSEQMRPGSSERKEAMEREARMIEEVKKTLKQKEAIVKQNYDSS